jgi:hypothetical protein
MRRLAFLRARCLEIGKPEKVPLPEPGTPRQSGAESIRSRYFGTTALSSKKNLDDTHEEFFRRENRQ